MKIALSLMLAMAVSLTISSAGPAETDPTPANPNAETARLVSQASPAPNSAAASIETEIVLTLSAPIDASAWQDDALSIFGRWSGVAMGTTTLEESGTRIRFVPDQPFQAGETVTATLRRNVRLASGGESGFGYTWNFWIRPDAGSFAMIDRGVISVLGDGEDHVQPYGAYAGGYNGDGMPDLAIPNEVSADVRVLLNDGQGGYEDFYVLEMPGGNWPSPNEGADFDNDGITDFVVGNAGNDLVTLFMGDGQGGFEFAGNSPAGLNVRGVCIMDLNGDGWPDVATANMGNRRRNVAGHVSVLLNDGTGKLKRTASIESPGVAEKTCATGDANEDGIPDLFVGAYGSDEILLFLGDGVGSLEFATKVPAGGNPWMIVVADINGDGHVDVISSNRTGDNVGILLGDGKGGLGMVTTYPVGSNPLAVDVGDIDGDGDLDVVTSEYEGNSYTLYENAGDGTLISPRTLPGSGSGSCAVIHDRDRDGDLDITGIDEKTDKIVLFENPGVDG